MSSEGMKKSRRRFLTGTVSVVGGLGVVGAAIPFIQMWQPSARAQAAGAPVEIDVSRIEIGQMLRTEWRGKPVWVVRRGEEMLATLEQNRTQLRDPDSDQLDQQPAYAKNVHRSSNPEYLILVGLCTHLGCAPKYVPEIAPQAFDPDWKGGFFCPCHNSRFDLAGRVFESVPAPVNLEVPPYTFLDEYRVLIGVGPEGTA